MTTTGIVVIAAMVVAAVTSAVIGAYGVRARRRTSDFLLASRTVHPAANAAAISGEYLSAASFLGVAGLVLRDGVDALWYPVGFAAGYLALVFFVVAPLRRSGAYTVPDFAEARLHSPVLRRLCTAIMRSTHLGTAESATRWLRRYGAGLNWELRGGKRELPGCKGLQSARTGR